ncbi:MAG TPA: efflux RND transporter permease subunit [Steroidobacteraceae bacterium]|nr:efflux RND transporter permease subunit [Steroidobacteraceae bacterium]
MLSRFFIDRPIFAWVIAIITMIAGGLSVFGLPVRQYPAIAPPTVGISVSYPGASAQTVQDTVIQVIEQQLNGIDNLTYISSEANSDGTAVITLTFTQGTVPDVAQVQVQNKLQLALPLLPQEVQQSGVRVNKPARNFLVVMGFISADNSMSNEDLTDYVATNLLDPLNRTPGVGDVTIFGAQYAMRIWLDPARLNNYGLTTGDVVAAIRAQNVQVSVGSIGGLPAAPGQAIAASIIGPTRMSSPEEFRNILLRVNADGSQVRVGDVGRVGLNSESYIRDTKYNGKPAAGVAIRLAAGQNALDTMAAIHETIGRLQPFFPRGLEVQYPLDTTPFVRTSILEVVKTLFEAVVLVFLVMYLFLQNARATLIPTIAVPVVLLGTFGVLAAFGFSINTLTMFGMALSIGLLVDDAIVVVENVERVMAEEGLSPREATRKSMDQITGALVAIALVLAAVFVPMAFFGGSIGVIYRQFSITLVSAMGLSVLVALILTPALCATILKPLPAGGHVKHRGFFGWFNRVFDNGRGKHERGLTAMLAHPGRSMLVFAAIVLVTGLLFSRIPSSFLPPEDPGFAYGQVQTPPGASKERTWAALDKAQEYLINDEKDVVEGVLTVNGFNFAGTGQNSGLIFIKLKDWDERKKDSQSMQAFLARTNKFFASITEANVIAVPPPAVLELGNTAGFDLMLQNRGGLPRADFLAARNQLLGEAAKNPVLVNVRPNGVEDAPQFKLDIDREKASALGLSIADVNQTLQTGWASTYVNDFIDRGRVKRVYVQGDPQSRMQPEDLNRWYVRNNQGNMVPFSAFGRGEWTYGPQKLLRFNGVPAFQIQGAPAPGHSSGEAMQAMEEIVAKLPAGVGLEWNGLSYEEKKSGSQAPMLYVLSIAIVFLCLAALYESWSIPATVLLVVPLGVLGAVLATLSRGLTNDAYFQVGLLVTVGLAAKNAILIVEFAKEGFDRGDGLVESVMHAAKQRLRPIIMTSLAFMSGVLPLALSSGAGSGAQHAVGTGVIGGMLAATFLAVFFVPVFFVVILRYFKVKPVTMKVDETPADVPYAGAT